MLTCRLQAHHKGLTACLVRSIRQRSSRAVEVARLGAIAVKCQSSQDASSCSTRSPCVCADLRAIRPGLDAIGGVAHDREASDFPRCVVERRSFTMLAELRQIIERCAKPFGHLDRSEGDRHGHERGGVGHCVVFRDGRELYRRREARGLFACLTTDAIRKASEILNSLAGHCSQRTSGESFRLSKN